MMPKSDAQPGQLYILSGPSGSGKDTMLARLKQKYNDIRFSVSYITRNPRPGEIDSEGGGKYHFITLSEFTRIMSQGGFLEHNEYLGNFYGTPREPVDKWLREGYDVFLEIDVNGAKKVRDLYKNAVSVFIIPPSLAELSERLVGRRTEDIETAQKRLVEAITEIGRAEEYDYIIVNDDLNTAVDDLSTIIQANRLKKDRMIKYVKGVLKDAESFHW